MSELRETPLAAEHRAAGAKMVPFAGWSMPIQYTGIIEEHRRVRNQAGLFDVSHMGEVRFKGPDALKAVQYLITNDASKLVPGGAQYALLCKPSGTVIDDIIVYRLADDEFLICVNASNVEKDFSWFSEQTRSKNFKVKVTDESNEFALLALQGPQAPGILQKICKASLKELKSFQFLKSTLEGLKSESMIARTGYTGEDGFEIFVAWNEAALLWKKLLAAGEDFGLKPVGLGARDTLRLEMKYPLYGNDLDEDHTPIEAALGWAVKTDKENFLGKGPLAEQKKAGAKQKLVGFKMLDKSVPRHGYPVWVDGKNVGPVTSGTFGPSVDCGIGLAYIPARSCEPGQKIEIEIRGKKVAGVVVPTPFYQRSNKK